MKWLTCNVELFLLLLFYSFLTDAMNNTSTSTVKKKKKKEKDPPSTHTQQNQTSLLRVSTHIFVTRINTTDLLFHHKTSFSMFPCLCNRGQITEKMIARQSKELFHRATVTTLPSSCFVYILQWRIYLLLRICCPFVFSSTGQLRGTTPPCLCASADQRKESIYNIFIHIFIYY